MKWIELCKEEPTHSLSEIKLHIYVYKRVNNTSTTFFFSSQEIWTIYHAKTKKITVAQSTNSQKKSFCNKEPTVFSYKKYQIKEKSK